MTRSLLVAFAMPPRTLQTKLLSPCRSIQGWKWSEMLAYVNPHASARAANRTRSGAGCSSLESAYPMSTTAAPLFPSPRGFWAHPRRSDHRKHAAIVCVGPRHVHARSGFVAAHHDRYLAAVSGVRGCVRGTRFVQRKSVGHGVLRVQVP